jgi:hypothetical protein
VFVDREIHLMTRWRWRILIAAVLIVVAAAVVFEAVTHIGRGWLFGEPFYEGRPASFWAVEIERWETQDPVWETRTYSRRATWPAWVERYLPEPRWPRLLDGDPDALPVLRELTKHPSSNVQEWAQIGIERIDNGERGPLKIKHPTVLVTAELFEVDEAFHKRVASIKWVSMAEFARLEQIFLNGQQDKEPGDSLFDLLDQQKPLRSVKDIKIDAGKERVLHSSTKEITCLPSPAQLRKGQKDPQRIEEGMVLRAQAQVTWDRRFVRLQLIEKISELEGIDKVPLAFDEKGEEAAAEIAIVKESTFSVQRTIPDNGTLLVPLQYRPAGGKEGRRWVARIEVRIYIEAEERVLRGEAGK